MRRFHKRLYPLVSCASKVPITLNLRFVHNILIISGVALAVSLTPMALMSMSRFIRFYREFAKNQLTCPNYVIYKSTILIFVMPFLLISTLRLMDARAIDSNVEDVTSLYIIPRFKHDEKV